MKIIVGLGNPGVEYQNTPHSVGFETVDAIAAKVGVVWEEKRQFRCLWTRVSIAGSTCLLVKPQTFMNLSGESVAPIVKYSNSTAADLVIVQDDIDLALGRLRIRKGGSCGGHNGVRNIIERLGTSDFVRLKLGVGKDKSNVIGFVLGKFSSEARTIVDREIDAAVKAVVEIVKSGHDRAMNLFNATNCAVASDEP